MSMNFVGSSSQRLALSNSLGTFRNVTGGTLMFWVKLQGTLPASETTILFYSINDWPSRLSISYLGNGLRFRCAARRLDADSSTLLDGTTIPTAGVLFHVCAVAAYNGASFRLYVNGVQENSATVAGWTGATSNTDSATAYVASNSIGGYFTGLVTDVRTYNRALSAQEVGIIYGAKGRDRVVAGMQDRWKFMDGANGTAGNSKSIGLLQGVATQTNNPLFAENMGISTRARRR